MGYYIGLGVLFNYGIGFIEMDITIIFITIIDYEYRLYSKLFLIMRLSLFHYVHHYPIE